MANKKQVIRKVERSALADFDEQLWPINCALVILAGFVAGLIIATSDFEGGPLFYNGWFRLGALGLSLVVLLAGSFWLHRRRHVRRMQLAVLLSLLLNLALQVGLYQAYLNLIAPRKEQAGDWLDEEELVTLPDYGREPTDELAEEAITQPVETATPDRPTDQLARQEPQPQPQPAEKSPAAEPTPESRQPTPAEIQRAEMAVTAPRQSAERSGQSISRQPLKAPEHLSHAIPTPEAPAPEPSSQAAVEARATPLARQSGQAQLQRRDNPSEPAAATEPAPAAQLARRSPAQPAPTMAAAPAAARQAASAAVEAATIAQPQAAVAETTQASPEPQSAALARSSTEAVAQKESLEAPAAAPSASPASIAGRRTTSEQAPQVAAAPAAAPARELAAAAPASQAIPQPQAAPVAQAEADPLRPTTTDVARRSAAQLPEAANAAASSSTPDTTAAAAPPAQAALRRAGSGELSGPSLAAVPAAGQRSPAGQAAAARISGTAQAVEEGAAVAVAAAPGTGPSAASSTSAANRAASGIPAGRMASGNSPGLDLPAGPRAAQLGSGPAARADQPSLAGAAALASVGRSRTGPQLGAIAAAEVAAVAGAAGSDAGPATPLTNAAAGTSRSAAQAPLARADGNGDAAAAGQPSATIGAAALGAPERAESLPGTGALAAASPLGRSLAQHLAAAGEADLPEPAPARAASGAAPALPEVAPLAGLGRRSAGLPAELVGRAMEPGTPGGTGASPSHLAAAGPQRAAAADEGGPSVAGIAAAGPARQAADARLPSGWATADEPGPIAGMATGEGLVSADPQGPGNTTPARQPVGALPVQIAAVTGPGGLSPELTALPGLPHRRARPDSDTIHAVAERFLRDRSSGMPAIDGRAVTPAAAFEQRMPDQRRELAKSRGGNSGTERAVELGLEYLARQQLPDGRWSLQQVAVGGAPADQQSAGQMEADTAATGLALLCYLGAGYTHLDGKYRDQVAAGISHLVQHQKPDGDLFYGGSKYAWLYSHGIASIALCEAYGMTGDPALREPAQRAIDFIVAAQHPTDGGWRYAPRTGTDTSVSGWQVMALKSGELAGLRVPEECYRRVSQWLDVAQGGRPSRYTYRPQSDIPHQREPSLSMTAEGLLMRLYTGWERDHEGLADGAAFLQQNLPTVGSRQQPRRDAYYWYYATQFLFQVQGQPWEAWNERLREMLVTSQVADGPLAGSWDPRAPVPDRWGVEAGRLYVTAMHLLMLEVYYRHLPLYQTLE